ncbi:MAG: DUF92 domain-containing protein [Halobacteriota archaeon]
MSLEPHLLDITVITILVAGTLVLYSYLKRKISNSGFIGTLMLGTGILLTLGLEYSFAGLLALMSFFLFGNLVTKYKYETKARLGVAEGNKGRRGINNVVGNGLSPLIFAILYALSSDNTIFLLGFSGSVATACADTFSTEIGQAYGKPRLITTLKKVPVGTSGGVSLWGLGAALLGSFLVTLVCLTFGIDIEWQIFFIICLLAGFLGGIADSILGATVEDRKPLNLNKHHVNILATLFGGIFAIAMGYALLI